MRNVNYQTVKIRLEKLDLKLDQQASFSLIIFFQVTKIFDYHTGTVNWVVISSRVTLISSIFILKNDKYKTNINEFDLLESFSMFIFINYKKPNK